MVNESAFDDNASQWEAWRKDKAGYKTWLGAKIGDKKTTVRSHGFRFRGQYDEEIKHDLDSGGVEITAGVPGEKADRKTGEGEEMAAGTTTESADGDKEPLILGR